MKQVLARIFASALMSVIASVLTSVLASVLSSVLSIVILNVLAQSRFLGTSPLKTCFDYPHPHYYREVASLFQWPGGSPLLAACHFYLLHLKLQRGED